jgi:hypothetical protein
VQFVAPTTRSKQTFFAIMVPSVTCVKSKNDLTTHTMRENSAILQLDLWATCGILATESFQNCKTRHPSGQQPNHVGPQAGMRSRLSRRGDAPIVWGVAHSLDPPL